MSLERRGRATGRSFWIAVGVVFVVKLWLTSVIRILPAFAPHDASNFLEHAKSIATGQWFGPYDDLTLIKQPFFPMYLAAIQEIGIPLTIAHLLLDACAALVACYAIRPIVRSQAILAIIFAILFFDPFSFDVMSWVAYRSQVNPALALMSVACAFALFVRRRTLSTAWPWAVGLGAAFSAFWLNREEAIWLVPAIVILLAATLWWTYRHERTFLRSRLMIVVIPAVMLASSVGSIMLTNGLIYGWFVTNEQYSREFSSAYNSLARITVPHQDFIPVPRSARLIAYSVSDAARELEPALEAGGKVGDGWRQLTCSAMPRLCGDIAAGWFLWAFRDAVAASGHYTSGRTAREFYVRLATEVDAACSSGRIRCGPKAMNAFVPVRPADLPAIVGMFLEGSHTFLDFSSFDFEHWKLVAPEALHSDYNFIARDVEDNRGTRQFSGWLVHPPLKSIEVQGPDSVQARIYFLPSPDIEALVVGDGRSPIDGAISRFEVLSFCLDACSLKLVDRNDVSTIIPLNVSERDFSSGKIRYHLDVMSTGEHAKTDRVKVLLLKEIARSYTVTFQGALIVAFVLVLLRIFRTLRSDSPYVSDQVILFIAVGMSNGLLILLLAIISALAFPAFNPEYMGSSVPLALFAVCVTFATDGLSLARLFVRVLPPPTKLDRLPASS